ncbi:ComEC/Rec2 family competence protein [Paragemmobacter straminiformis]|uniref:ComEC/Rec2 family competence protein n=1 Tax=Paragemmobacter straminiformis TaxID=2045119 RepID=UPI00188733E7|nr:ComEC/Rec2 family competence protein [Gemmobacter straminiformis]
MQRLLAARGHLFPFAPVGVGTGVGLWFSLPVEPAPSAYLLCLAGLVALLPLARRDLAQAPALFLACLLAGVIAAGLRAHLVQGPMLQGRYYGPVTGRVVEVDRSQTDALRVTLDRVALDRVPPGRTPLRARISLHGDQSVFTPKPGQVVMVTANLAAPEGPVEPGSFDFRQMAYFEGLGAVGYTRSPMLLWQEPAAGEQWIGQLRSRLTLAIQSRIAGDAGAFAAGAMTGDRSGLSLDAVQALRDSSLAHLLAISGMNLAFLIGFVFSLLRYGLALLPYVALRIDTRKLAALVSLGVASFYLLLSGANVATERAFIMVLVMLGAVLFDRRAITLRSVSLAALILLLWQPEALLAPGFQMSFAATIALIAGFEAINARLPAGLSRLRREALVLVVSSLIGGLATAPYAAAHFNRFADYGFLANLLTVPVMGAVVMPAGAMAALLAPVGLADAPLWVMGQGAGWILYVARLVAGIEGAVTAIPAPPPWVLPVLTLGLLWAMLWRGGGRFAGLPLVALALVFWAKSGRPALLVTPDARLAGLLGPEGRALSKPKGGGFAAKTWLENDGDLAPQDQAAARAGFVPDPLGLRFTLNGQRGLMLVPKADLAGRDPCTLADIVILPAEATGKGCLLIDLTLLSRTGAVAVYDDLRLVPTRSARRLWSP